MRSVLTVTNGAKRKRRHILFLISITCVVSISAPLLSIISCTKFTTRYEISWKPSTPNSDHFLIMRLCFGLQKKFELEVICVYWFRTWWPLSLSMSNSINRCIISIITPLSNRLYCVVGRNVVTDVFMVFIPVYKCRFLFDIFYSRDTLSAPQKLSKLTSWVSSGQLPIFAPIST